MLIAAIVACKDFMAAFAGLSTDEDAVNNLIRQCLEHYLQLHPTRYLAVVNAKSGRRPCACPTFSKQCMRITLV
jgi:hypothetical protein